ncbi:MAG: BLUF domain-containing protein [Alphaproteobacteria bacterium]|nr:BLUF domain-containing protein [Alphaproteobacteria bacterium]
MSVHRLVYVSRPFGFDSAMLNGILLDARENNSRNDITGALICRGDMYLQLLEGPEAAVEAAFDRIASDDRHTDIVRLLSGPASGRLFSNWAMHDDPARSWMWTQEQVAAGAPTRASEAEVLAVFTRVSSELTDLGSA